MQSKSDEKSAQGADYKQSNGHSLSSVSFQTNPLAPTEGPVSCPASSSILTTRKPVYRIPPRCLALCGGGMRCIAHIGVFKALEQEGMLRHVKHILGVSAGALFGLCYVLGYSLADLERLAVSLDFTVLQNIQPESLFQFPFTYGLDTGESLDKFVQSLLVRKGFSADITFAELAALRPIRFSCYATDIVLSNVVLFNLQNTPNVSIRLAVRASMSLPVLYAPIKDPRNKHLLMDGGVLHNLPLVFQTEEERKETLAIMFTKSEGIARVEKKDMSLTDVFQSIYDCLVIMRNKPFLHKYHEHVCCIPMDDYQVFNFQESVEQRKALIDLGQAKTLKFLQKPLHSRKPVRRFSCS